MTAVVPNNEDILGGRGLWAFDEFSPNNAEQVLELTRSVCVFSSQFFAMPHGTAEFCEALEFAGAASCLVNLPGDVMGLLKQVSLCVDAFEGSGVASNDFLSLAANFMEAFGLFILDVSLAGLFLVKTKVIESVSASFKMIATLFYGLAVLKKITDNIMVISAGDKGKASLQQYEKDLISANYSKNGWLLFKNLTSLTFVVGSLAAKTFAPWLNLGLMITGVGGCAGDFFYKREMQYIVAEKARA